MRYFSKYLAFQFHYQFPTDGLSVLNRILALIPLASRKYVPTFPYHLQCESQARSPYHSRLRRKNYSSTSYMALIELVATNPYGLAVISKGKKLLIISPFLQFISATYRFYFTFNLILLLTIGPLRKDILRAS